LRHLDRCLDGGGVLLVLRLAERQVNFVFITSTTTLCIE
jgi:hypothetical protein